MDEFVALLRCPVTGQPLQRTEDGGLATANGRQYPESDGVLCLLPQLHDGGAQAAVREFYESSGWSADEAGLFGDTKSFVDTRGVSFRFTRQSLRRLVRYFKGGGRYLLDAGSGPIAYDELLSLGAGFDTRVCVDLSARALRAARTKLGDRGLYIQGDLTSLPLQDGSMDAITCNHVIYQLPPDEQRAAFLELWRVLRPGGVAAIVYWWASPPLEWRLERLARLLPMRGPGLPPESFDLPHHPHSREWFEAQEWPFSFKYDIYRAVTNAFMRQYISDDWRGALFLGALDLLQRGAPSYCGKRGVMPIIVVRKN